MKFALAASVISLAVGRGNGQVQAPALGGAAPPISPADRIYTGDQASNTITVIQPATGAVLGTISLGDARLGGVLNPQYVGSVNAHGLGFSRDGRHIVSLSVTTNTATVIRCADNAVVSRTYTDRNPHEAFFAPDNRTVWVGTRGVDSITVIDGLAGGVVARIPSPGGPSKVLFSPDGATAYANHINGSYISVIDVAARRETARITGLADRFSSDMMLSADGERLWAAHKMVGKVSVVSLRRGGRSGRVVAVLDTGAETNHPQFAVIGGTTHGFVTVAAANETRMYAQPDPDRAPEYVGAIRASGVEPHGLWPSPDNTRMYILNEHSDTVDEVDLTARPPAVVRTLRVGQEGQALVYVANAVPHGDGTANLGRQGLVSQPAVNKIVVAADDAAATAAATANANATTATTSHQGHGQGPAKKAPPSALVTVRQQGGVDMFQVIGRDLRLNTTYTVAASCSRCGGHGSIPLVDFKATVPTGTTGCGSAPQVLAFFKFFGVYDLDSLTLTEAAASAGASPK
ncbi:40-residue YVTN family beta-propeller repeat protein [Cordyceps javanica]|uniref:40-residue YVTN family beta-propeller repeat protein n=1 Tax=Cordyceps javanica TaxID=43265 RepID=A0A545V8M8_9HYPO|nr:40-residue YVTN family beta-propeller repeat protein [Cordyceps javanica]TQW08743.1 40-residue YVTN family beta-propeller repeat protein [Cordyceps javanica]